MRIAAFILFSLLSTLASANDLQVSAADALQCDRPVVIENAETAKAVSEKAASDADSFANRLAELPAAARGSVTALASAHALDQPLLNRAYFAKVCERLAEKGISPAELKPALQNLAQALGLTYPEQALGGGQTATPAQTEMDRASADTPAAPPAPIAPPSAAPAIEAERAAPVPAPVGAAPALPQAPAAEIAPSQTARTPIASPPEAAPPASAPPAPDGAAPAAAPQAAAPEPASPDQATAPSAPEAPAAPAPAPPPAQIAEAPAEPGATPPPADAPSIEPAPAATPAGSAPKKARAKRPEGAAGNLGEEECRTLGVLDSCPDLNAVLDRLLERPLEYNHPSTMLLGRKTEITLVLRTDWEGKDLPAEVSEELKGLPGEVKQGLSKITRVMSAELTGREFDISPSSRQERTVVPPQPVSWSWQVSPTDTGEKKPLKLRLYAHLQDGGGAMPPILVKTLDASINVDVTTWDWVVNQARTLEPIYAIGAALLGLLTAILTYFLTRGREPVHQGGYREMAGTRDSGPVIGDLGQSATDRRAATAPGKPDAAAAPAGDPLPAPAKAAPAVSSGSDQTGPHGGSTDGGADGGGSN